MEDFLRADLPGLALLGVPHRTALSPLSIPNIHITRMFRDMPLIMPDLSLDLAMGPETAIIVGIVRGID